jgi:drug/metabolite transporter (DMT)-like permease
MDVLSVTLIAFLGGLPIVIPAGTWELSNTRIGPVGLGILGGVLFLGIISTALAMVLWNTAFAVLDASVASLTFFAQPVVGTLLGWIFLKETITPLFLIGGLFIAIGLIMASRETGT